jgi:hypothetical protein
MKPTMSETPYPLVCNALILPWNLKFLLFPLCISPAYKAANFKTQNMKTQSYLQQKRYSFQIYLLQ